MKTRFSLISHLLLFSTFFTAGAMEDTYPEISENEKKVILLTRIRDEMLSSNYKPTHKSAEDLIPIEFKRSEQILRIKYNQQNITNPELKNAFTYFDTVYKKKTFEQKYNPGSTIHGYLGLMHMHGWGTPRNLEMAFYHFKAATKASRDTVISAKETEHNLAVMYLNGWGTPRDLKKAYQYFIHAGLNRFGAGIIYPNDYNAFPKYLPEPCYYAAVMSYGLARTPENRDMAINLFKRAKSAAIPSSPLETKCSRYLNRLDNNKWGFVEWINEYNTKLSNNQSKKFDIALRYAQSFKNRKKYECFMCFESLKIKNEKWEDFKSTPIYPTSEVHTEANPTPSPEPTPLNIAKNPTQSIPTQKKRVLECLFNDDRLLKAHEFPEDYWINWYFWRIQFPIEIPDGQNNFLDYSI